MSNIFNFKRFGLVLRKDFLENWKLYTLLFLTMLGVITIVITWISFEQYKSNNSPELNVILLRVLSMMFGAFGLLFASTFMNPMNNKTKRIAYLLNPSSNIEKFMTRWIIVTVGYAISFFIALWIADIFRVVLCTARYQEINVIFLDLTKLVLFNDAQVLNDLTLNDVYAFSKELFIMSATMCLLFQSLFILGSTFWEKTTFVKTFTAGILILLSFILICRWTILLFYGNFEAFVNVLESILPSTKIDINTDKELALTSFLISVFTLANWTLSFFRFRESEIIKRL